MIAGIHDPDAFMQYNVLFCYMNLNIEHQSKFRFILFGFFCFQSPSFVSIFDTD